MDYINYAVWIPLSILLIGKGSDWLTDSLIPMSKKLGVSGVAVGLILVSVAVSLPEVLVALYTTYKGYIGITFGVILGSIFVNIGLMTGLSALFRPDRSPKTWTSLSLLLSLFYPKKI